MSSNLIKLLIKDDEICAKEFIKNANKLSHDEIDIINKFGQYTLEVTIFYLSWIDPPPEVGAGAAAAVGDNSAGEGVVAFSGGGKSAAGETFMESF